MPRRYVDYPDAFAGWNYVSSIGSYISSFAVLVFLFGVYRAFAKKVPAGDNPWGEGVSTLEWTLTSPPPFHQFGDLPEPVDFGSFANPGSLQGAVTDVTRDADH